MTDQPTNNFPPPAAGDRAADPGQARPAAPQAPQPSYGPPRKQPSAFARGFGLGSGFAIGASLASAIAAIVFTLILMLVGASALLSGAGATTTTQLAPLWGSGSAKVRAIPISGAILSDVSDGSLLTGGTYGNEIAAQIDNLADDEAEALVLLVNTPGGSIGGSKAISDAVERYQKRTEKKAFVHVTSMSASGGVYATASADEIIADHGALVGSIGVIFGPFMQYDGVVATSGNILESGVTTTGGITSEYLSEGTGKDFGNPYRPITAEERTHYQTGLANEYDNFVNHVADHRGIPAATIKNELGAHLFDTKRAEEVGLTDGTMSREDFYFHVAETVGIDPADMTVEAVRAPSAWEALLGAERADGTAPKADQGDGIVPGVSAAFCEARQPLAFAGDLASVCG